MKYNNVEKARFVKRLNRFVAHINVDGNIHVCHVKNTGRLKELLTEGAEVFVQHHHDEKRKTNYSLIAVKKDSEVVNIDSQAPNKVFYEWVKDGSLLGKPDLVKPETVFGNSRFDCYIEKDLRKIFVEVKGVTLEREGVALFPDAPTERGVKHLHELCECVKNGYEAYIVFVIQMKGVHTFSPNKQMHKEFADALAECERNGVKIVAVDCIVTPDSLEIDRQIEIKL